MLNGDAVPQPRRALFLAPFNDLADPQVLVDLAVAAEEHGWEGFFLWDHIVYRHPVRAVADPWVALGAIAARTRRLVLGPLVTPLPRRRIQKLARETASLDVLCGGRSVLGVGIGNSDELEQFGEVTDPRERARMLDDGLAQLISYWRAFEPRPVQQPRIPVWTALRWPNRRPLRRAVRWDGLFPVEMPGPEALVQLGSEIALGRERGLDGYDLVAEIAPGEDAEPWRAAGATWVLTGFGMNPRAQEVHSVIAAGPR